MSKKLLAVLALGAVASMAVGFAACTPSENEPSGGDKVTVSFIDGTDKTTVLKTVEVEKGSTVEEYVPEKDGYEFVDWFGTPSMNHEYDFSTPINNNVSIFAGFTKYVEDDRVFYVVGSGTSELLFTSAWGDVITDSHKLTKAEGKNEYSITMDLKAGDEFQFALNSAWENKRGFGYLDTLELADGTAVFSGQGSPYDDSTKGQNIKVEYSGNYTLTLYTYPNEDYYNTSAPSYTEEQKEVYNLGMFDKITWVRNGDVLNDSVTITDYYIKGADITGWSDMYNLHTQMLNNGSNYTLSIYLNEGEEFMFTSRITKIEDGETSVSGGSTYINSNNIAADDASWDYVDKAAGTNLIAKAAGTYTFTYDGTNLKVAFDADEKPAAQDYYLDGDFLDGANKYGAFIDDPDSYKLVETEAGSGVYKLSGVEFKEGQLVLIRAYAAGATASWDATHTDYQFTYLAKNDNCEAESESSANIRVLVAGTYDITFDSYSQMITILPHVEAEEGDVYDIYIKGASVNNWNHNFDAKYKMTLSEDKTAYEMTIELTPGAFMFERHDKGSTSGYGNALKASNIGTEGDANSLFTGDATANSDITCTTAGTYRIVYTIATEKVDFYKA